MCIEAVQLFGLAGVQGHADAQAILGTMFEYGEGVAQDTAEAIRWYRLAAEQGHDNAQHQLGVLESESRKRARGGA